MLQKVHGWNNKCNHGHGGVERTLELLKAEVGGPSKEWIGMRTDVKTFISQCPQCQFMQASSNAIKQRAQTHPFNIGTNAPWQRIALDSMGPFPEDKFEIQIIVCFLSKLILLKPKIFPPKLRFFLEALGWNAFCFLLIFNKLQILL